MKPLHVGLLVMGAAVAGGLAVRMTQPPALPRPAASTPVAPARPAVLKTAALQPVSQPVPAPSRPAPLPAPAPVSPAETDISAPPPVYSEPRHASARPSPFPEPELVARPEPYQPPPARVMEPHPEAAAAMTASDRTASNQTASAQAASAPPTSALPAAPLPLQGIEEPHAPRRVTLEPGMTLVVRTLETLSSDRVSPGDAFSATLDEPLIIDGLIIAERGARVDGRVVNALRPARMNGRSELQLALSSIMTADGQRVAISTEPWSKTGAGSGANQAEEIGGGAALGAVIGALAGGGAGAAIGAGIGGGAGLGAAIASRARPVSVPSESVIRFRVNTRITITERQL